MEHVRAALAIVLCLSLCAPPISAQDQAVAQPRKAAENRAAARPAYRSGQLQGDERVLHALNRLTFGPRPGDLEAVKSMGLDRWFEQQLHPSSLDNTELAARLAQFPAMQWSAQDLLYRLPSDAMIRQAADGKVPIPQSGALYAVYENQLARYALKKQAKGEKQPTAMAETASAKVGSMQTGDAQTAKSADGQMDAMQEPRDEEPQFDPRQIESVLALPPAQRVARLATMQQGELDSFRKQLKGPQRAALLAGLNPEQKEVVGALENPKNLVNSELCEQRLMRDIYSNAQLLEVMTDFWLNHFNVFLHKNEETPYYLVSYERDVIRPRALGKFEDLLEATAHSPAMLLYLDNAGSIGPDSTAAEKAARNNNKNKAHEGLNENYARELMELHTLGVNGGYTQKDVTQVARVFTGWTVEKPQRGGGFQFDENRHEPGSKQVLGKKIKENGEREGQEVLHMLALRPATAQFLSRKLAIRFVSDDPPKSLVDRMAKSYLSSGGDIATVLRTMYRSPEFWAADTYRAKVKTPLEYVVSSARTANAQIDDPLPLVNALRGMGMGVYGSIPPTGYSWQSSTWVSAGALVNRMNFALLLASNKFGGIAPWAPQPAMTITSASGTSNAAPAEIPSAATEEQRLETLLIEGGVSESTRAAVLDQAQGQGSQNQGAQNQGSQNSGAQNMAGGRPVPAVAKPVNPAKPFNALERQDELLAGLLLGSPEFQRR
jgi:uncharacterized protein (DUF1800 family)